MRSAPTAAMDAGHTGNRVGQIDSLRCLAMTAVVAQHCGLLPFGWTGVWLFFVISGYVVTLAVVRHSQGRPTAARLTGFFRRRIARIVPVYYAYVLAGVAVTLGSGAALNWFDVASLLGFFHNVAMGENRGQLGDWPVGHLWTISVEMQFYLVYGCLLILAPRRAVLALLLVSLVATPIARLIMSVRFEALGLGAEFSAYRVYSGSFLHTDVFAAGALLAFAKQGGYLAKLARRLALSGALALLIYCVFYIWMNRSIGNAQGLDSLRNIVSGILWGQYREVVLYSVLALAAAGLVALAATNDPHTSWLLKHRLLQRIGEISYGAYIIHAVAIVACTHVLSVLPSVSDHPVGGRLALFSISYALTVIAAEFSFRHFESRFTHRKAVPALSRGADDMAVAPGEMPPPVFSASTGQQNKNCP